MKTMGSPKNKIRHYLEGHSVGRLGRHLFPHFMAFSRCELNEIPRPQLRFTLELQVILRFLAPKKRPTNRTNRTNHQPPSIASKTFNYWTTAPFKPLGPNTPSFTCEEDDFWYLKIHHLGFLCSLHCQSFHAFGLPSWTVDKLHFSDFTWKSGVHSFKMLPPHQK